MSAQERVFDLQGDLSLWADSTTGVENGGEKSDLGCSYIIFANLGEAMNEFFLKTYVLSHHLDEK